jgi:hypothetical protein
MHGGSRLLQDFFEDALLEPTAAETSEDTLLEPTAAAAEYVEPDMEFFECCEWSADGGEVEVTAATANGEEKAAAAAHGEEKAATEATNGDGDEKAAAAAAAYGDEKAAAVAAANGDEKTAAAAHGDEKAAAAASSLAADSTWAIAPHLTWSPGLYFVHPLESFTQTCEARKLSIRNWVVVAHRQRK